MNVYVRIRSVLFAVTLAGLVALLSAACATAAPIVVNLRVEGTSATIYEGPVSVEPVEPPGFATPSTKGVAHPCDVKENGKNEGFVPAGATPTAALRNAVLAQGLAFDAEWSSEFNDFLVSLVGSEKNGGAPEYPSWGYAVNYTTANVGGCQFQLAPGSEVLWAYNYFNLKHLLSLSGPASVTVGVPFTVHVTDGQTGEPIAGAAIGQLVGGVTGTGSSSPTTNAAGNATVTLTQAGTVTFKATQNESVRSNGLTVSAGYTPCACDLIVPLPTPKPVPPDAPKIEGVKNGHVYSRRSAPRLLAGLVEVPVGGTLRQVRISLQRRYRGRCFDFSGSRESFVRTKKCGAEDFFSVGGSESFSYLLPKRLPKGSYTYDIEAIDSTGQATRLINGVSHVVFKVR